MFAITHKTYKVSLKSGLMLCIALLPSSVWAEEKNAHSLSLTIEQAVQVAIQNSKPLQTAARRVDLQQGVVAEKRAGFNPTIGSQFNLTQYNEATSASFNGQDVTLAKQTQKEIGLNTSLPLDISGQIRAAVGQAQIETLATRLGYNVTRNELVTRVKSDYYTILRRQALVEAAQSDLKNAQERLRVAEANHKAGVAAQFDVLRAQTDAASAQEALLQTRNSVNLALAQLRRTLGIEQTTFLAVEKVVFDPTYVEDEATMQDEALSNRPERLQAQLEIRAAEQGVKLARRSALPDLSLSFGYAYQPDASGFNPRTSNWQAGVAVRIPLFDGGVAKARVHQARQAVEIARTELKNTEEQVALEVQQAYVNLQTAQERIPVAEAALTQARESYRLALVRFRTGVTATPGASPLVEVTDAQAALTRAQNDLVNAQYDHLNSRASLHRALGRFGYGEKPGIASPDALTPKGSPAKGLPRK